MRAFSAAYFALSAAVYFDGLLYFARVRWDQVGIADF